MLKDKLIEKNRWDNRAIKGLDAGEFGSDGIPEPFRAPYLYYEKKIKDLIHQDNKILEIGAGTGLHTYSLIKTGAHVTATDISTNSLKVLENYLFKFSKSRLQTMVADIEKLPFENESFDVVLCAGSLSYGDRDKVDKEIFRVIKPSGYFICVDALNNNPFYKFYRLFRYLTKSRTKLTYKNTPNFERLKSFYGIYSDVKIRYFGSIIYLVPILSIFINEKKISRLIKITDDYFHIKRSAYKFVLVAKK